jgi:putative mRNA 3-end processing factor
MAARKRTSGQEPGELFDRRSYGRGGASVPGARGRRTRGSAATATIPEDDPLDDSSSLAKEMLAPARPASLRSEPVDPRQVGLFETEPLREFEYVGGIHLTDSVLWCDCDRRRDLVFLSHAHADFIGKHRRILATDKTVRILTHATGKVDALTSPYRRRFTLGPLSLEMHPAGHVLGSAQILIERGGRRLVYTSDVNTRPSATAEKAKPLECDVLSVPATYGLPLYRFPPREEVIVSIRQFIDACLNDGANPVLIAERVGLSQELMRVLGEAGYKLRVHGSIYEVAKVYRELGISLPNARRFGGTPARDEVVIFPPVLRKHAAIRKLRKSRTAMVTGRAVEPGFAVQQRVDAAFPLADACDYEDLKRFIKGTGAAEVYLTGGFVEELSADLRAEGVRVFSLVPPKQLALF